MLFQMKIFYIYLQHLYKINYNQIKTVLIQLPHRFRLIEKDFHS